jgi:hypothetical protein
MRAMADTHFLRKTRKVEVRFYADKKDPPEAAFTVVDATFDAGEVERAERENLDEAFVKRRIGFAVEKAIDKLKGR